MKWAQMTFVVVWALCKLFFVDILYSTNFIHITGYNSLTTMPLPGTMAMTVTTTTTTTTPTATMSNCLWGGTGSTGRTGRGLLAADDEGQPDGEQ
jgi:hypothetical protein